MTLNYLEIEKIRLSHEITATQLKKTIFMFSKLDNYLTKKLITIITTNNIIALVTIFRKGKHGQSAAGKTKTS